LTILSARSVLSTHSLHAPLQHPPLHSSPTRRSSDLYVEPIVIRAKRHAVWISRDRTTPDFTLPPGPNSVDQPITLGIVPGIRYRSEEHTSELQSRFDLVCRLLLEKKKADHQAPQARS